MAVGMGFVLWLSGSLPGRRAFLLGGAGLALVLLSHTRTALLALIAGVGCASFTLFVARRRVRRLAAVALALTPIVVVALSPALSNWFTRGQSVQEISGLTGRKQVWTMLLTAPRSEFNQWFGVGLSDKSFAGHAIDSTWLALYHEQGLVGVGILGTTMILLLLAPALRPPGAARAVATFLVVYCAVAAYTEVGAGDASPYMLHIVVAASLFAAAPRGADPCVVR